MSWLLKRGWKYAAMLAVSAFALFPVYWVLITSLKPRSEIYSRTPDLWPSDPQWHEYPRVLGEGHVGRALMNSLIVAGATTVVCLIVGAMAAYALTRFDIPFKRVLMMLVLMTQMFPLVVLVIPLFVIMRNAELLGTYVGPGRLLPGVHRAARDLGDARLPGRDTRRARARGAHRRRDAPRARCGA